MADSLPDFIWMSGKLCSWESATVHASLLGHATVSAVFEGIRGYMSSDSQEVNVFRLREHMLRLNESMKIVRMKPPFSVDELCQGFLALIRANRYHCDINGLAMSYLGGLSWGFSFPEFDRPTEMVIRCRLVASKLLAQKGLNCCVSSWLRISDRDMPPRAKCVSNYHNGRLAAMEAQLNGYDQALLLNHEGKLAEAPGACVFVVRRGDVTTPPVTSAILESITRSTLIQLFEEEFNTRVQEREIDRTEIYVADEVFICGTAVEVTPIVSIDHYCIGNGQIGDVTREISRVYNDIVRGQNQKHSAWRTPVWAD